MAMDNWFQRRRLRQMLTAVTRLAAKGGVAAARQGRRALSTVADATVNITFIDHDVSVVCFKAVEDRGKGRC